jgi:hypothetical protein
MDTNTRHEFGDRDWKPLNARADFQPLARRMSTELTDADYEFLADADADKDTA